MPFLYRFFRYFCWTLLLWVCYAFPAQAQVINSNLDPASQQNQMFNQGRDSAALKTTTDWKEEKARIYYNHLNSALVRYPDTSLECFHRYQPVQPWWGRHLGNYGSAARNQFFTPFLPMGQSLGYHIYDLYRISLDSLRFYNTTRPYSAFSFMLGSKTEQNVDLLHTQNITPGWNVAARIRYYSSNGFYNIQKTNNIGGSISTNYQSKNQRYYLAAGLVYNKFRQNENGGIRDERLLDSSGYADRQLIPVVLPAAAVNSRNPAISNQFRDYDFYLQNNYSFGRSDTLYNKDSTGYSLEFTPRFRIKHQLQLHAEKHVYLDVSPQTASYQFMDTLTFTGTDTLGNAQNWFYVDNKFSLNGFLGKRSQLVQIEAGIGNRIERFSTQYDGGEDKSSSVGNYVFGELKKEAFAAGQWSYLAAAALYFTGDATGNFDVRATAGKDLGQWGTFSAGFRQNLGNAPYAYATFKTNFFDRSFAFDKTSITQLSATVQIPKIKLEAGIKNHLIANYIYYDNTLTPRQQSDPFSVLQLYGRKLFRLGPLSLDNEVVWQQPTGNAPVNLPAILLRHRLGIETALFRKALYVSAGVEAKYHTPYYSDGYTAQLNQFYYQKDTRISNPPECLAYFNFKVKAFRAFVIADQLQQYLSRNVITAPAYSLSYPAVYAMPNALFRFGFTWILIN